MQKAIIESVAKKYGLTHPQISPPQKGYRNESHRLQTPKGAYNLILYKREPGIVDRIRRANHVANHAAHRGLPARETTSDRIIQLAWGQTQKYGALYTYLPGATIPWEAYTRNHIKVVGLALGKLHTALQDVDVSILPNVVDESKELLATMQHYFANQGVQTAMTRKLGVCIRSNSPQKLAKVLQVAGELPDKQALHMDFVRGNLLFKPHPKAPPKSAQGRTLHTLQIGGVEMSGILDFEKTAMGNPIFDIARTLAFLLVDCKYKPEEKVRKYFLYSGYQKRGHGQLPNTKPLETLVDFFLLHDFYKFLRHNPYEFLEQNEHFVRTRDLLVRRGVVVSCA